MQKFRRTDVSLKEHINEATPKIYDAAQASLSASTIDRTVSCQKQHLISPEPLPQSRSPSRASSDEQITAKGDLVSDNCSRLTLIEKNQLLT